MSLIIQVTTIDGRVLESLRREVTPKADFQEGHTVQFSFATKEKNLAAFVTRLRQSDCSVEKELGNDEYSVIVSLMVRQIRHMLDIRSGDMESLAVLTPSPRAAEAVLTYLVEPDKCDPRAVAGIKGQKTDA